MLDLFFFTIMQGSNAVLVEKSFFVWENLKSHLQVLQGAISITMSSEQTTQGTFPLLTRSGKKQWPQEIIQTQREILQKTNLAFLNLQVSFMQEHRNGSQWLLASHSENYIHTDLLTSTELLYSNSLRSSALLKGTLTVIVKGEKSVFSQWGTENKWCSVNRKRYTSKDTLL